jgi:RNA polymerase sigma-70 factor (ECF subfamily)
MTTVPDDSLESDRLLQQACNGSMEAFDRLFARHRNDLHRMLDLRMDPRLRQRVDPSDLVQEAHLEAVRRLDQYTRRRPMPFRIWLRRIAYERLLMMRRRHVEAGRRAVGRELAIPDNTSMQLAQHVLAGGPTPSQAMVRDELVVRVREAMQRLAETDREVLIMRNLEGLSTREVADSLGIEPAAVSKRYGRALLRLKAILTPSTAESHHDSQSHPADLGD